MARRVVRRVRPPVKINPNPNPKTKPKIKAELLIRQVHHCPDPWPAAICGDEDARDRCEVGIAVAGQVREGRRYLDRPLVALDDLKK